MLSARSWKAMRVFSPLVRALSLQFVHQGSNRLLLACRLFETCQNGRRGKKCHLKQCECQFNPSFSCLSLPKGETWGVNKKPSTLENKPCGLCCSCRVRPWTWHQSVLLSAFCIAPLKQRVLYSQTKAGYGIYSWKAFCQSSTQPKRWGGSLASLTSTGFGRSAQQNTAAKYVGLRAHRATNTPTEPQHNNRRIPAQATSSQLHSSTSNSYRFILCNFALHFYLLNQKSGQLHCHRAVSNLFQRSS